jgi:REP element-mobilizing transposase RayT
METLLFHNQYRIPTTRLQYWNYGNDGWYYLTICTKQRKCHFGKIKNYKMYLSPIGKIVEYYIKQIPQHFPNATLETFIIMPNHIHLIITLDTDKNKKTMRVAYLNNPSKMSRITPEAGSIPVIIGSFKAICKKTIVRKYPKMNFSWQTRYYDHLIRKRESMYKISQYILNNPIKWEIDRNNPKNIC